MPGVNQPPRVRSATFKNESDATLDGKYQGREVRGDLRHKKWAIRARAFFVGPRLYQMLSVGTVNWVESADTDKFFDSFTLTK